MPLYALDGISPELPMEGDYWIAPSAEVIGKVRLLGNASIWFGAVLRGDNEWITLGQGSNDAEGCQQSRAWVENVTQSWRIPCGHGPRISNQARRDNPDCQSKQPGRMLRRHNQTPLTNQRPCAGLAQDVYTWFRNASFGLKVKRVIPDQYPESPWRNYS